MNDSERKPPAGGGRPSLLGNGSSQASAPGAADQTRVLEQLGGQREQRSRLKRGPVALAVCGVFAAACVLYWNTQDPPPTVIAAKAHDTPASIPVPAVATKAIDAAIQPPPPSQPESAENAARVFVAENAGPVVAKAPPAMASTPGDGASAIAKAAPVSKKAVQPARLATADKAPRSAGTKHASQGSANVGKSRLARSETARKNVPSGRPDPDPDTDLIAAMLRRSDDTRANGAAGTQRARMAQ